MFGIDLASSWLLGGAGIAGIAAVAAFIFGGPLLRYAFVVAGAALLAGAIWTHGGEIAQSHCDAAAQKHRADQAEASLAEARRQLAALEKIALNDAARAAAAEERLRQHQGAVNDTPKNTAACLDDAAARRVFNVR